MIDQHTISGTSVVISSDEYETPRQRGEDHPRPEADPGVAQHPGVEEDYDRGERVEDGRGGADAGFRIAADLADAPVLLLAIG